MSDHIDITQIDESWVHWHINLSLDLADVRLDFYVRPEADGSQPPTFPVKVHTDPESGEVTAATAKRFEPPFVDDSEEHIIITCTIPVGESVARIAVQAGEVEMVELDVKTSSEEDREEAEQHVAHVASSVIFPQVLAKLHGTAFCLNTCLKIPVDLVRLNMQQQLGIDS